MKERFRFKPPAVNIQAEIGWAISRALVPGDRPVDLDVPVDGEGVFDSALHLGLAARIGARTDPAILEAEAGVGIAGEFRKAAKATAISMLQLEAACRNLARLGKEVGAPVIFLKGMALHLAGRVALGQRGASDVDVLVPRRDLGSFVAALKERGWQQESTRGPEHHAAPLYHPAGVGVEVHTLFRGVRLGEGNESADAGEVLDRGLCERLEGWPGETWIPGEDLLAAHLLVHGIAQHGTSPQSYPLFRVLTDVLDLGLGSERPETFMDGAYRWIARDVGEQEVRSVAALAQRLCEGQSPVEIARGDDLDALWLRHLVLGALDDDYRRGLRLGHLAHIVPAGSAWRTRVRTLRGAFFINDRQVELIYGRPTRRWGYWGRKLWRPFDLLARAGRYGSAWLRTRARRRAG